MSRVYRCHDLRASRFWQAKADEISRLMLENDQLRASIEELKVCLNSGSLTVSQHFNAPSELLK